MLSGSQRVEHDSERKDVRGGCSGAVVGEVAFGADDAAVVGGVGDEADVREFGTPADEDDVGGFDIPMDEAMRVQVRQGFGERQGDFQNARGRESAVFEIRA